MENKVESLFHKEPPRWVQGRAECRVDLKFAALRQVVERDVADFNGLSDGQRGGRKFKFNSNEEGTHPFFTVEEEGGDMSVEFLLTPHSIRVNGGGEIVSFYPRWNIAERTCKLCQRDKDTPLEVWEISQMALSPIFFSA